MNEDEGGAKTETSYAKNIRRFFVFWALVNFNLWMPIWVVFFQERGLSLSRIGILDAAGWTLMAVSEVATGAVADRYGRKTSMIIGALAWSGVLAGVTTKIFSPIFLIAFLFWGSSWTFISGADMAFLYDSLKAQGLAEKHPRIAGRYLALMNISGGVASVLGGWVATQDMNLCFYASATAGLLAALVASTFVEPPRSEPEWPEATIRYRTIIKEALKIAALRPVVRYQLLFGAASAAIPFMMTWMLMQPYAISVGIPVWSLGVIAMLVRTLSAAGSLSAERVARAIGPSAVIPTAVLIIVGSQIVLWQGASPGAVVLFIVIAVSGSVMRPTLSALLNREIPSAQRATILSIESLLWTLLLAVMEPVLFALADRVGIATATGISGLVAAAILSPLIVLWWRAGAPPRMITPEPTPEIVASESGMVSGRAMAGPDVPSPPADLG